MGSGIEILGSNLVLRQRSGRAKYLIYSMELQGNFFTVLRNIHAIRRIYIDETDHIRVSCENEDYNCDIRHYSDESQEQIREIARTRGTPLGQLMYNNDVMVLRIYGKFESYY